MWLEREIELAQGLVLVRQNRYLNFYSSYVYGYVFYEIYALIFCFQQGMIPLTELVFSNFRKA
jgi:hypothetical protein